MDVKDEANSGNAEPTNYICLKCNQRFERFGFVSGNIEQHCSICHGKLY